MRKQGNIIGRDRFLGHVADRLGRQQPAQPQPAVTQSGSFAPNPQAPVRAQSGSFAPNPQAPVRAFKGVPEHYADIQLNEQERLQLFVQNWTALNGKVWVVKQEDAAESVKSILQELLHEQGVTKVSRWNHDDLNALEVDNWMMEQGIEVVPWTDGQKPSASEQLQKDAISSTAESTAETSNWSARSPLLQSTEQCGIGVVWPDYVVANTGTLALFAYGGRGRSVSLLPERLFAIFRADQLVTRMGEVFSRLKEKYPDAANLPSSVNLITGPSRSADIENDLTIGVHGPGQVFALIID